MRLEQAESRKQLRPPMASLIERYGRAAHEVAAYDAARATYGGFEPTFEGGCRS